MKRVCSGANKYSERDPVTQVQELFYSGVDDRFLMREMYWNKTIQLI